MTLTIENVPAPLRIDPSDLVRVGETRVPLDLVVEAFQDGAGPEEIVLQYPVLDLAEVYAVLAYYLRHRDEVDAYVQSRAVAAEEGRERSASQSAEIRERLLARRGGSG